MLEEVSHCTFIVPASLKAAVVVGQGASCSFGLTWCGTQDLPQYQENPDDFKAFLRKEAPCTRKLQPQTLSYWTV